MKRKTWPGWAVLWLAASVSAASNAEQAPPGGAQATVDPDVVATVNGDPVYLEDLERRLNATHSGQAETHRDAYDPERLVNAAIDDALLAQEGRAMELQDEPPIPRRLEAMRRRLALERLEQVEIQDKVHVSDEDLRRTFEQDYETVRLRILTVRERDEAERLLAELRQGGDFEALVAQHSVDQYSANGGLMEDLARRDIPGPIVAAAWGLEPGELTGPVRTALGWSILEIEKFTKPDPARFDRLADWLREEVRIRESATLRGLLANRLQESLKATIDYEVLGAISVDELPDGRLTAVVPDPAAPVARIGDFAITAEELGDALNKRWRRVRNKEAAVAARELVLHRLLRDDLLQIEALRRGYGDTPEAQRKIRAFETEQVAKRYLDQVVAPRIEIGPEELRAYYDEHLEEFRRPPRVHLGQITVKEEDEANRIAELLRQGTDLAWLARQHSIDGFKDSGGDRGWMVPQRGFDELQTEVFDAAPGDVIGPMGAPGNYIVMQVGAREEQGYFPFEEVAGAIRPELFRPKFEAFRQDLIRQLRSRSEIEINKDVLASLRFSGVRIEEDDGAGPGAHGHP